MSACCRWPLGASIPNASNAKWSFSSYSPLLDSVSIDDWWERPPAVCRYPDASNARWSFLLLLTPFGWCQHRQMAAESATSCADALLTLQMPANQVTFIHATIFFGYYQCTALYRTQLPVHWKLIQWLLGPSPSLSATTDRPTVTGPDSKGVQTRSNLFS
jgi:hypothetical protein